MGFFSSSKSKLKYKKIPLTTEQQSAQDYYVDQLNSTDTMPTSKVADLSNLEQTASSLANQYVNSGNSDTYNNAINELNSTILGTSYSAPDSTAYKALKKEAATLTDEGIARINRQAQKAGIARSTSTSRNIGDYVNDVDTSLLSTLGMLEENERNRQVNALNTVLNYENYADQNTRNKIGTASTVGAVARAIQQAKLDAQYNATMNNITNQQNAANILYNKDRYQSYVREGSPSMFSQLLGFAGSSGGQALMSSGGSALSSLFTPTATTAPATAAAGMTSAGGIGNSAAALANQVGLSAMLMSDERLKLNIAPIDNALEKVEQLDGKTYQYTFAPNENRAGLIAQDIEKVLPQAVAERDGFKVVNYEAIIGLLVNAVKEQQEQIRTLKHQIQTN